MLFNSWPFRALITRTARAYGFLDPIRLVAKLRGFSEPSEIAEPIELLRAGLLFHARGLINTKAIQNNLDWIWPYWVERQFNPSDVSFIPRAFSFSHINLTHRNWTAVGVPDVPYYPIVDPRGLVTPLFDGWSLDFWFVPLEGAPLFPSRLPAFTQSLALSDTLRVTSAAHREDAILSSTVSLGLAGPGRPEARIELSLATVSDGFVAVALRPYNPEGVTALDRIESTPDHRGWTVNGRNSIHFDRRSDRHLVSSYKDGDVSQKLGSDPTDHQVVCPVGMATAAALFSAASVRSQPLEVRVPIYDELHPTKRPAFSAPTSWSDALAPLARLELDDGRVRRLYDLAAANLVLHSPGDVYPGPYTYKRFWFRDTAFLLNALLTLGGIRRARRALDKFGPRQRRDGYFLSQAGEWDSNGEALWIYHRFAALTGETLPPAWRRAVARGARWITRKRLPRGSGRREAGLLPAGFSAEHLGPNDFYYWDDFWGVAGLRCAADLLRATDPRLAARCAAEADEFLATIERSFPRGPRRRFPQAIPAAPKRRMDSGAIGSLVADYPLQLFPPGDPRILATAEYLRLHSMHGGGFFQQMIHSGINAYLTLHLAQVSLRAGDHENAWTLMDAVARLASPTGQWPEAIHPRTDGGCMGDGEHIWAAAEWTLLVRACFVREEPGHLVIGAGLRPEWLRAGAKASFGPTLTPFGVLTVSLLASGSGLRIEIDATWRAAGPRLEICVPGHLPLSVQSTGARTAFALKKSS
jgi:hypothetical protein